MTHSAGLPGVAINPAKTRDRKVLAGRRFLVVDDHPHMIDVVCEILRHFGASDLVKAVSAEEALAKCSKRDPFDCVVCDFNMKPINGLQVLQSIRMGTQPHVARDQPFILLTGHGEIDVVKAAVALDVSAYVVKPVAVDIFLTALNRALAPKVALHAAAHYQTVPLAAVRRFQ